MSLGAWLDHWLAHVVRNSVGSASTYRKTEVLVRRHIKPALGSVKLRELSPAQVDRFLVAKAAERPIRGATSEGRGYSTSSVARMRQTLTAALEHAEKYGHVSRNAGRLSTMPKCDPAPARRSLTPEEARAIIEACDRPYKARRQPEMTERLGPLFVLALGTGLRPGELLGLRWGDLDLESATPSLTVARSMKETRRLEGSGYLIEEGEVKRSTNGRRTLALSADLAGRLKAHQRAQRIERMANADIWSDSELVFSNELGGPLDQANVRRAFKRICDRAGVEGKVFPYLARHTAVSLMLDAGATIEQAADVLGDDPATLYRHYRHRVRPVATAAAEILGPILAPAVGG